MGEAKAVFDSNQKEINKIKIMLVDDHPLIRQALRNVLEKQNDFEVIAEASDGEEAVKLTAEFNPDVVIMDISLPKLNGLDATKKIKADFPGIIILVLTIHSDKEHILSVLRAGAGGYLTKGVYGDEVVHTLRALVAGEAVFSKSVAREICRYAAQHIPYIPKPLNLNAVDKLNSRELEIIKLAANGMSNKDIADNMGLSVRTVKGYLADLFLKLNVASRTEAVVIALQKGILTLNDIG